MPFRISSRAVQGLQAVSPKLGGGFEVAERPNPNSGMATFQRGQGQTAVPGEGMNPLISAGGGAGSSTYGQSALSANLGLMQRGLANRRSEDYAHSTDMGHPFGLFNSMNTVAPNPQWEGYKQSLFERGVDHLHADADSAAGGQPSFFAGQNNSALEQLQRLNQVKANDLNFFNGRPPANYQDPTRGR